MTVLGQYWEYMQSQYMCIRLGAATYASVFGVECSETSSATIARAEQPLHLTRDFSLPPNSRT